jgi:hypothetical protein
MSMHAPAAAAAAHATRRNAALRYAPEFVHRLVELLEPRLPRLDSLLRDS